MAHHELHSAIVAYLTEFGASAGLSEDDAESLLGTPLVFLLYNRFLTLNASRHAVPEAGLPGA